MTNYWIKTTLGIIVIGFLIFYPIQTTRSAGGIAYILKEFSLDLIARVIARTFLSQMVNQVTDFIAKKGRDAGPSFVQDWRNFLGNAQYRGEDITRAIIGDAIDINSGTICSYLKSPIGSAFGAAKVDIFQPFKYRVDSLQYYNQRNRCTLPAGFNVSTFRNDFSGGGGWAAWAKLIQPQNNFYGVYNDSLTELSRQRGFEEKTDKSEAESGSGFTSKRSGTGDSGCEGAGMNTSCLILGQIMTPGQILENVGANLNTGEFDWLTGSDELSEVLLNVTTALVGRLGNFTGAKIQEKFTADTSQGDALCVQAGEGPCYEKAKKLDCSASATGGSGGSSIDTGGSGGDANVNCIEVIDQTIYDACMAEVRDACGFNTTQQTPEECYDACIDPKCPGGGLSRDICEAQNKNNCETQCGYIVP